MYIYIYMYTYILNQNLICNHGRSLTSTGTPAFVDPIEILWSFSKKLNDREGYDFHGSSYCRNVFKLRMFSASLADGLKKCTSLH